jgi:hypothetical protein
VLRKKGVKVQVKRPYNSCVFCKINLYKKGECYGSALARAALVPIGLGLASLGYLSMRCFLFPTSFLSFI